MSEVEKHVEKAYKNYNKIERTLKKYNCIGKGFTFYFKRVIIVKNIL